MIVKVYMVGTGFGLEMEKVLIRGKVMVWVLRTGKDT